MEQAALFNDQALVSILTTSATFDMLLMDSSGTAFEKISLQLNHQDVGCHGSELVVRRLSSRFGAELAKGTAEATEYKFRKLPDGTLQVTRRWRDWVGSMKNKPREAVATILFPPVP